MCGPVKVVGGTARSHLYAVVTTCGKQRSSDGSVVKPSNVKPRPLAGCLLSPRKGSRALALPEPATMPNSPKTKRNLVKTSLPPLARPEGPSAAGGRASAPPERGGFADGRTQWWSPPLQGSPGRPWPSPKQPQASRQRLPCRGKQEPSLGRNSDYDYTASLRKAIH